MPDFVIVDDCLTTGESVKKHDTGTTSSRLTPSLRPGLQWEFSQFPNLPEEVRRSIWKYTFQPRVVAIEFSEKHGFNSIATLPAALHVCQESRAEALRSYTPSFGTVWYKTFTYLNFSLDVVYLTEQMKNHVSWFFSCLNAFEVSHIRYVAFDEVIVSPPRWHENLEGYKTSLKEMIRSLSILEDMFTVREIKSWFDKEMFPLDSTWKERRSAKRFEYWFETVPNSILRHRLPREKEGEPSIEGENPLNGCVVKNHINVVAWNSHQVLIVEGSKGMVFIEPIEEESEEAQI